MARPASGNADLEWAREQLSSATTVEQLRRAQAIFIPLVLGLSLEKTAMIIGRSVGMTCKLRTQKHRERTGKSAPRRHKKELRNRAATTLEKESGILDKLLANANNGGIVTIPLLKPAYEKAIGKTVALSTLYRTLARHGWRKLAPDTQHPQGDVALREEWKKNSPTIWRKP